MPEEDAVKYRFNPFDITKIWPHTDYPLQPVGRLVLNRNPENYFAEVGIGCGAALLFLCYFVYVYRD